MRVTLLYGWVGFFVRGGDKYPIQISFQSKYKLEKKEREKKRHSIVYRYVAGPISIRIGVHVCYDCFIGVV